MQIPTNHKPCYGAAVHPAAPSCTPLHHCARASQCSQENVWKWKHCCLTAHVHGSNPWNARGFSPWSSCSLLSGSSASWRAPRNGYICESNLTLNKSVNGHLFSTSSLWWADDLSRSLSQVPAASRPRAGIQWYMMDGCLFLLSYSGFKGFKMYIFCALIVVRAHHLLKGRHASELAERWERHFDREVSEPENCPGRPGAGAQRHVTLLKGSALDRMYDIHTGFLSEWLMLIYFCQLINSKSGLDLLTKMTNWGLCAKRAHFDLATKICLYKLSHGMKPGFVNMS